MTLCVTETAKRVNVETSHNTIVRYHVATNGGGGEINNFENRSVGMWFRLAFIIASQVRKASPDALNRVGGGEARHHP